MPDAILDKEGTLQTLVKSGYGHSGFEGYEWLLRRYDEAGPSGKQEVEGVLRELLKDAAMRGDYGAWSPDEFWSAIADILQIAYWRRMQGLKDIVEALKPEEAGPWESVVREERENYLAALSSI
jgi:hypothetical protein